MQLNEFECNCMNSEEFGRIRKDFDDFGRCRNKNSNNLKEFERIRNVKLMEDHKYADNNQLLLLLLGIRYVTIWNNFTMSLTMKCASAWASSMCALRWSQKRIVVNEKMCAWNESACTHGDEQSTRRNWCLAEFSSWSASSTTTTGRLFLFLLLFFFLSSSNKNIDEERNKLDG